MTLPERLFAASTAIRYVAIYRDGQLQMQERPGISKASSSESDRYEELIVNPTLLKLLQQRGEIDCGGLEYVLVRYANFFQWVCAAGDGHVSVAIDAGADAMSLLVQLKQIVAA